MSIPALLSPLQLIAEHPGTQAGITLFVKRDDLLHPDIQGNKWRKLAPVLAAVKRHFPGGIVTFGGPFSNHLQAVAAAGRVYGIPTTGWVRGLHADLDNPTLRAAQNDGMTLRRIAKSEYEALKKDLESVQRAFPGCFVLPEGGATPQAVAQCADISREIIAQLAPSTDRALFICVPAGTGSTAVGIVRGLEPQQGKVLVFPVVNRGFEVGTLLQLLDASPETGEEMAARFRLVRDYEFGGFARFDAGLLDFVQTFHHQTGVLLDPVYTAKMMYGVFDLLRKAEFPEGSTVVAVHTGGLQGWEGYRERYGLGYLPFFMPPPL